MKKSEKGTDGRGKIKEKLGRRRSYRGRRWREKERERPKSKKSKKKEPDDKERTDQKRRKGEDI